MPERSTGLHCCWVIDPWDPRRDKVTQAWSELFDGAQVTVWHAGQLGDSPPKGDVELRHVSELSGVPFLHELGFPRLLDYEISCRSHAAAADMIRYAVVHSFGGVYFDLDIFPNASAKKHLLRRAAEHGEALFERVGRYPEIRVIYSNPGDPLLGELIESTCKAQQQFIESGGYKVHGFDAVEVLHRTGPFRLGAALKLEIKNGDSRNFMKPAYTQMLMRHTAARMGDCASFEATDFSRRAPEVEAASGYQTSSL